MHNGDGVSHERSLMLEKIEYVVELREGKNEKEEAVQKYQASIRTTESELPESFLFRMCWRPLETRQTKSILIFF